MKPGTPAAAPATPRLQAQDLTVRLGGRMILEDVSVEVAPGQVVGVVGPNGAGKTTLINAICGDPKPDAGRVRFDGAPLRAAPHKLLAHGIARTAQSPESIEEPTILEHVMAGAAQSPRTGFGTLLRAIPSREEDEQQLIGRASQLLRELGLASSAGTDPAALPHAVRQRAALARALISNPRLLLLDEPAAGLGEAESLELGQLIRRLVSRPGRDCAVLLIEHHVPMVMASCDALVVLDAGRVIARGTPEEIRCDPTVADAYLGADPLSPPG